MNTTIVSLFRQQVKTTPNNIAVVYKEKKYTYAEVDEISDRIAGYILSRLGTIATSPNDQTTKRPRKCSLNSDTPL